MTLKKNIRKLCNWICWSYRKDKGIHEVIEAFKLVQKNIKM